MFGEELGINAHHPEVKDKEVFLTNCEVKDFKYYQWNTKRLGEFAYHPDGKVDKNKKPLFVKVTEMMDAIKQLSKAKRHTSARTLKEYLFRQDKLNLNEFNF